MGKKRSGFLWWNYSHDCLALPGQPRNWSGRWQDQKYCRVFMKFKRTGFYEGSTYIGGKFYENRELESMIIAYLRLICSTLSHILPKANMLLWNSGSVDGRMCRILGSVYISYNWSSIMTEISSLLSTSESHRIWLRTSSPAWIYVEC